MIREAREQDLKEILQLYLFLHETNKNHVKSNPVEKYTPI